MSWLALSDSFEYLCYGSPTIKNIFNLTVRGSTLDVRILKSKVDLALRLGVDVTTRTYGNQSLAITASRACVSGIVPDP